MPDPHLLYVVSGVVVLGLVTWVVVVLATAPPLGQRPRPAPPEEKPEEEPAKGNGAKAPTEPAKVAPTPAPADRPRVWLQSYGEIHDEPGATGSTEPHGETSGGEKDDPKNAT
jgi:hypothetical protein